jgi:starch synthase
MDVKVAICVSEAVPFAKTGGLADVAGALPEALKKTGITPIVVMPGYGHIFEKFKGMEEVNGRITLVMNREYAEEFGLYRIFHRGVYFYFVRNDKFFARDNLYGTSLGDYSDNDIRFGFFARAVFRVLEAAGFIPHIIHLHDYHFALSALLLRDIKSGNKQSAFRKTKTVFTIHNIAYQGIYKRDILSTLGIDNKYFRIDGLEFYGKVNYMKAGIIYSDSITTVSPTYAGELLTPGYGYGLDAVLKERRKDLSGIINGIDYQVWNPEDDGMIAANYNMEDISGKRECKRHLLSELFGRNIDFQRPVIGMVSRLSYQKGLDLIAETMDLIMKNNLYLVILGTGDDHYQKILMQLKEKHGKKFSLTLGYSDKMSREIYAGADIFLMPSRYEPCGLGQLISLKYGTVPLARDTGGLSDTIVNIDTEEDIEGGGTGFLFKDYDSLELYRTVKKALGFFNHKKLWEKIILNGMSRDFSWEYSANEYKRMYESMIDRKGD